MVEWRLQGSESKMQGVNKGARLYTVVWSEWVRSRCQKKCDFFEPFFGFPIPTPYSHSSFHIWHMIKSPTPFLAVFGFYDSKSAFLLHWIRNLSAGRCQQILQSSEYRKHGNDEWNKHCVWLFRFKKKNASFCVVCLFVQEAAHVRTNCAWRWALTIGDRTIIIGGRNAVIEALCVVNVSYLG